MPAVFTYTNPVTLRRIAQDLIIAPLAQEWIFKLFPIENLNDVVLRWMIEDNYGGLMDARGLGGEPVRIKKIGAREYEATPGYFGNFDTIDEEQLMRRDLYVPGNVTVQVPIDDLVKQSMKLLNIIYRNRLKQMACDLLNTGSLSVMLPDGGVQKIAQYTQQVVTPAIPWTNRTGAYPLLNMMALQTGFGRGSSSLFTKSAMAYANSRTLQVLELNRNEDDLYGKKVEFGSSLSGIDQVNKVVIGSNAAMFEAVDSFYLDKDGEVQMDIPDGVVHVIGARPGGEKPGATLLTANANNPNNAPGVYAKIVDYRTGPYPVVPPRIDVHMGFNGGSVMIRPKQHIKMIVGAEADFAALEATP